MRALVRLAMAAILSLPPLIAVERASSAQVAAAEQDLATSDDFRIRVGAALLLGKSKPPEARALLERALGDPHPAVRTAAAAALAALGDAAAIPALERRAAGEPSPGAKAEMTASAATLRRVA
jgi:HEAT repeat protein